jgi:uncharacterized protein Yka (UPF0111/DUF47 family)
MKQNMKLNKAQRELRDLIANYIAARLEISNDINKIEFLINKMNANISKLDEIQGKINKIVNKNHKLKCKP